MKKGRHYDKKVFRLLYILNRLDAGKTLTTKDLATEFSVTRRTVQRDIELLNMTGFPVMENDRSGYSFDEGFSLKRASLTKEEASLLSFLCDVSGALGGPFKDTFSSLLSKVMSDGDSASSFYVKVPAGIKLKGPLRKHSALLDEAIRSSHKVEVVYEVRGGEERFRLCPLKIICFDGFWYLLARPDGKSLLIKLRIEKIRRVEILRDRYFSPPRNLKTVLDQSVNIRFSDSRNIKVRLDISAEASDYFKKRDYLPLQKITRELKDGSLKVESKISQFEEVLPIIFRWLPHVTVESPRSLREQVRKILKSYMGQS
jgi:predicted DNA-binding transcriptional regulator YafY